MKAVGLTTWIWQNQLKTVLLAVLFPVLVFATIFIVLFFYFSETPEVIQPLFLDIIGFGTPIFVVWFFISLWQNKSIVFAMTGAKEIERKQVPELYNMVENLCISRGMTMPQIALIESHGMNAFATGWSKDKSWIVVTRGLVDRLTKDEIRAVLAHELTHIINRDVRLMSMIAVFLGVISMMGYYMFRISIGGNDRKGKGNILAIVGIAIWLLSFIILPLIQLAVSRKREFLADAGAVELTKDSQSMISALQKINGHSIVAGLDKTNIRAMCIEHPNDRGAIHWWSTHPSIEQRIAVLQQV
jgi:heat shock protein HtpX